MILHFLALTATGSVAPWQEELLFTQTALLSRTTHISRRYAIKHADPKCHKQVWAAAQSVRLYASVW